MKIEIVQILDRGVANQERLWLKVLASVDLSYFIVFSTAYGTPTSIANTPRQTYWFAPKMVAAGDSVVLYTKAGTPSAQRNPDGSTTHFLFWGLGNTIWNTLADCAVLFEVNSWMTSTHGR